MLRVFATMCKADEAVQLGFQSEKADLGVWAREIVEAASKHVVSPEILPRGEETDCLLAPGL
jgi:hypothetical protein